MTLMSIAWWLLIIGGLNWGVYALFKKDIFGLLNIGMDSSIAKVVYILVGLAALYQLFW